MTWEEAVNCKMPKPNYNRAMGMLQLMQAGCTIMDLKQFCCFLDLIQWDSLHWDLASGLKSIYQMHFYLLCSSLHEYVSKKIRMFYLYENKHVFIHVGQTQKLSLVDHEDTNNPSSATMFISLQ